MSDRVHVCCKGVYAVSQSRVIFRGTGWGTGLQQPQTGSTLHPQQRCNCGSLTKAFSFIGHDKASTQHQQRHQRLRQYSGFLTGFLSPQMQQPSESRQIDFFFGSRPQGQWQGNMWVFGQLYLSKQRNSASLLAQQNPLAPRQYCPCQLIMPRHSSDSPSCLRPPEFCRRPLHTSQGLEARPPLSQHVKSISYRGR